jgi:kynurenine formamidase
MEVRMSTIIDLSHKIQVGMPAYPGVPEIHSYAFLTHESSAERGTYAPGTTFQMNRYEISGNTGTYIDAPLHRYPDGPDLAALPLAKLANLPGLVVVCLRDGPIGPDDFAGLDVQGKAVLVRTDWSTKWGSPDYFSSGPYLTAEACRALAQDGATLVGIDCANIDNMKDPERPAHTLLLAEGIPIVEHLRGLDALADGDFTFFAVPPAILGGTSFPVRAFAIVG